MIQTAALTKTYRTTAVETTALDRVDLGILAGEFVAVMGPSGCGKSTLLNLLGLLDEPTSGTLHFLGEEVSRLSESRRTRLRKGNIGFVFQSYNLLDELSVYENVELPLRYLRLPAGERARRTAEALERARIAHRRDHYPRELSGGQQQRAAIARAVVAEPKLILADEPTGNLDSSNGDQVMALLGELNADGTTVVIATHASDYAAMAGRIIQLFDGRVVGDSAAELSRRPAVEA